MSCHILVISRLNYPFRDNKETTLCRNLRPVLPHEKVNLQLSVKLFKMAKVNITMMDKYSNYLEKNWNISV